jgi:hypothetical protein
VMVGLLVLYLIFVINYSFILIGTGEPIAQVMGWALVVLPVIGFWALGAEMVFIFRAERLFNTLKDEAALPAEIDERRPSGRPAQEAADQAFELYRAEAEASPESWRAWLRLGLAYDASGDRRRARWAVRRAITISRAPVGR